MEAANVTEYLERAWQSRDCTLFLSFDEWAEVEHYPWIREATEDEVAALKAERALGDAREGGRDDAADARDWRRLFEHDTVPYMAVTVLRSAPGHIWHQAASHLRLRRFRGGFPVC